MQSSISSRVANMATGTVATPAPANTSDDVHGNATGDIPATNVSRDELVARLTEMREWHMGKASASWSYETKERHERFAEWLNALEEQY